MTDIFETLNIPADIDLQELARRVIHGEIIIDWPCERAHGPQLWKLFMAVEERGRQHGIAAMFKVVQERCEDCYSDDDCPDVMFRSCEATSRLQCNTLGFACEHRHECATRCPESLCTADVCPIVASAMKEVGNAL